jgi:hypothetical protein
VLLCCVGVVLRYGVGVGLYCGVGWLQDEKFFKWVLTKRERTV